MAAFSEYQLRRFRFIFAQYSEDTLLEPATKSQSHLPIDNVNVDSRGSLLKTTYRLKPKDLHSLLPRFGPPLSHDVVNDLMHNYDSSCTCALDFEDFIEFLADYKVTLDIKRDAAQRLFAMKSSLIGDLGNRDGSSSAGHQDEFKKMAHSLGFNVGHSTSVYYLISVLRRAMTETDFLTFLNLDDSESLWSKNDAIIQSILEADLVTDFTVLKREIAVRIVKAKGLESFSRTKIRPNRGIEFNVLDPFVRVTIAGLQRQTSAILGTLKPVWDQELMFSISIPPGEVCDVVNWVQGHEMVLQLMDLHSTGNVSQGEVLAIGTVPLIHIFTTTKNPYELTVGLNFLDGTDTKIVLYLHATDQTQEKGAFSKVLDVSLHPEQYWRRNFADKMKHDLGLHNRTKYTNRKPPSLDLFGPEVHIEETPISQPNFWDYYTNVMNVLNRMFPRRAFAVLALDECSTFRLLTSFLCPIQLENPIGTSKQYTRLELAKFVADIPFYSSMTPFSGKTFQQLSKLTSSIANRLYHGTTPLSDAFLYPVTCPESLFTPVTTPSSLVSRGFGSVIDHAILLCCLFLGSGHDSYVAVGSCLYKHCVWVITIDKRINSNNVALTNNAAQDVATDKYSFRHWKKIKNIELINSQLVVQHWDVKTAKPWISYHEEGFPFERVVCLFNHHNIWFNVQPSDCLTRPVFTWDLTHSGAWLPFIASRHSEDYSNIMQCFHTARTALHGVSLNFQNDDMKLFGHVIDLIRSYRKIHLLTTTKFHRPLSCWQQSAITICERSQRPEYYKTQRIMGEDVNTNLDPGSLIPKQTIYYQRYLMLRGIVSPVAVLYHLVQLGLIDCGVPNCALTIAMETFSYPLGTRRTWIGIGAFLMNKLPNARASVKPAKVILLTYNEWCALSICSSTRPPTHYGDIKWREVKMLGNENDLMALLEIKGMAFGTRRYLGPPM